MYVFGQKFIMGKTNALLSLLFRDILVDLVGVIRSVAVLTSVGTCTRQYVISYGDSVSLVELSPMMTICHLNSNQKLNFRENEWNASLA